MMDVKIALVEDEDDQARQLIDYIEEYMRAHNTSYKLVRFSNADDFIEEYKPADIVFLDIMMPGTNGMDAAHQLRKRDKHVQIIFVTNMAQYAIKGYEVKAFDFIVKPVSYGDFQFKMKRVMEAVSKPDCYIVLEEKSGIVKIGLNDIYYVEVQGHKLKYKTSSGEHIVRGSMKEAEEKLLGYDFLKCNSCYVINPRYIIWAKGYEVKVQEDVLAISRPRKKQFMEDLTRWYSTEGRVL